jgi:hypothetical protein
MTVPVRSGHRLCDLGQASESLAIPGEAFLEDHDPLKLAVPLSHQQRAGLQADAVSGMRRARIEGHGAISVLVGAKHPLNRFVESAEGIGLQSISQHSHQQPTRKMGRRLATQMGAPLSAQPIEIVTLKTRHDGERWSMERQRSHRRYLCRLLRLSARGWLASHADHAAWLTFG